MSTSREWRAGTPSVFAILTFGFGLVGCPGSGATPVALERAEITGGDPHSTSFELTIHGRGFGLRSIDYNLSSGVGSAATENLRLEIFGAAGSRHFVERDRLTIETPQRMKAAVLIPAALPNGEYGIRLLNGDVLVAELQIAFEIEDSVPMDDDGGVIARDGDVPVGADAGPGQDRPTPSDAGGVDTGVNRDGGVNPDAAGNPDAEGPPDSGLGPWEGNFAFRRQVILTNPTSTSATAGTTVRLPILHQDMIASSTLVQDDGGDLALYLGGQALRYQYEDWTAIGTNALTLIAQLPIDVSPGVLSNPPLVLYYGDPAANESGTDAIFELAEHFDQNLPVVPETDPADGTRWTANGWFRCRFDRPIEALLPSDQGGTYCITDQNQTNPARRAIATPQLQQLVTDLPPNHAYEVAFWYAGQMVDGVTDIVYASHGNTNRNFDETLTFPLSDYGGTPPNASLTFQEINGFGPRTVQGFQMPVNQVQWWTYTNVRFVPQFSTPSFHFRYISENANTRADTFFALDDLTIRLVLEPDFSVAMGQVETR